MLKLAHDVGANVLVTNPTSLYNGLRGKVIAIAVDEDGPLYNVALNEHAALYFYEHELGEEPRPPQDLLAEMLDVFSLGIAETNFIKAYGDSCAYHGGTHA
jgi:hypothetical protein